MILHEIRTDIPAPEVITRARAFFAGTGTPYAAFAEEGGEAQGYLKLHMEVGEIIIGTGREGDRTHVRASASRGGHHLTAFLTTLAPPLGVQQAIHRFGQHDTTGALTDDPADQIQLSAHALPRAPAQAA